MRTAIYIAEVQDFLDAEMSEDAFVDRLSRGMGIYDSWRVLVRPDNYKVKEMVHHNEVSGRHAFLSELVLRFLEFSESEGEVYNEVVGLEGEYF